MSYSNYAANELLDHTFGEGAAWAMPTAWWVQLHTGAPGNDGTANVWAGPGRAQCTDWSDATTGRLRNAVDILWEDVPDPGPLPDITHCSIWTLAVGGNCLQVCEIDPAILIAEEDDIRIVAGTSLLMEWVNAPGEADFRYVVEDFNDWTFPQTTAWISTQPAGTRGWVVDTKGVLNPDPSKHTFEVASGQGRNGTNALAIHCEDPGGGGNTLPGWWWIYRISTGLGVVNPSGNDDNRFFVPRGLHVNYFDLVMKFPDGFMESWAGDGSYSNNHQLGSYTAFAYNGGWNEDNNWHWYHNVRIRYDLLTDGWVRLRYTSKPSYQRSTNQVAVGGPGNNPTHPHGDWFTLLTNFYWDPNPYANAQAPECPYPYDVLIDEIAIGWDEPPFNIDINIDDYVSGQTLELSVSAEHSIPVTVTNNGQYSVTGYIFATDGFCGFVLQEVGGGAIAQPVTFAAWESKSYRLHTAGVDGFGSAMMNVTVNATNNTIQKYGDSDYGLYVRDGMRVRFAAGAGPLPSPLVAGTDYWTVGTTSANGSLSLIQDGSIIDLQPNGGGYFVMDRGVIYSPLYVSFVRSSDAVRPSVVDSNMHNPYGGLDYGEPHGRFDAHVSSSKLNMWIRTGELEQVGCCEGGIILDCPTNGSVSYHIPTSHQDGSTPSVSIVSQPSVGGTVAVDGGNVLTFTATPEWTGVASFIYGIPDQTAKGWVNVS